MTQSTAELSSLASVLDDLTGRIAGLAERYSGEGLEDLASELFEVERSLLAGQRRLQKIVSR